LQRTNKLYSATSRQRCKLSTPEARENNQVLSQRSTLSLRSSQPELIMFVLGISRSAQVKIVLCLANHCEPTKMTA
jgi:hypothetical protein